MSLTSGRGGGGRRQAGHGHVLTVVGQTVVDAPGPVVTHSQTHLLTTTVHVVQPRVGRRGPEVSVRDHTGLSKVTEKEHCVCYIIDR